MLVQNLASTNYFAHANPVKHKENREAVPVARKKGSFGHNDTYIPSNSQTAFLPPASVKAKNLAEIRDRIASGFYDSKFVTDDLTDAFSGMFRQTIALGA